VPLDAAGTVPTVPDAARSTPRVPCVRCPLDAHILFPVGPTNAQHDDSADLSAQAFGEFCGCVTAHWLTINGDDRSAMSEPRSPRSSAFGHPIEDEHSFGLAVAQRRADATSPRAAEVSDARRTSCAPQKPAHKRQCKEVLCTIRLRGRCGGESIRSTCDKSQSSAGAG
jgi:hypothetical protein